MFISPYKMWFSWGVISLIALVSLGYVMLTEKNQVRHVFTPASTSHGHYQIEMSCNACHTPTMEVDQQSCLNCHAKELELANDTHPASKFDDPVNADRLKMLDAQNCITCHEEHVPRRTTEMCVTLPKDFCWHCHQDISEQRPSHKDFGFKSCSTSGCHNYHDNTALYENFVKKHLDDEDFREDFSLLLLDSAKEKKEPQPDLTADERDAPDAVVGADEATQDWAHSAHAKAGVNCTACHTGPEDEPEAWAKHAPQSTCQKCHPQQSEGFLAGHHGMRLAEGLSPMQPQMARLPMKPAALHKELSCTSCHPAHNSSTRFAAVNACISCHNDQHSKAYLNSPHYKLWQKDKTGLKGVSCAGCHMPRMEIDGVVTVQHNQNATLRPSEKMVRTSCLHCHGLDFTLNALADKKLIENCFATPPDDDVETVNMVRQWFAKKEEKQRLRKEKNRLKKAAAEN